MRIAHFAYLIPLVLSACMGMQMREDISIQRSSEKVHLLSNFDYLDFQMPADSAAYRVRAQIDPLNSYARHGDKQYSLQVAKHTYAGNLVSTGMLSNLRLVDPENKSKPHEPQLWRGGEWVLHIAFTYDTPLPPVIVNFTITRQAAVWAGRPN